MRPLDRTYIEGKSRFETTHWSVVRAANTDDQTRRQLMIGNLTATYWKPVYCYLRRKGYNNEDAKDLTQGFFCEIVLGRDLIKKADQLKGHFRTFLLTALDRYIVSVIRRKTRQKVMPKGGIIELSPDKLAELPIPNTIQTPEEAFYCGWAADILDQVLSDLREEYCSTNRSTHWEIFRLTVLMPITEGVKSTPLKELCEKFGVDSTSKASNMIVTVKRRFRAILRRRLRDFTHSDAAVEEELKSVFEILSKCSAR
jgi:DNA-directed RNA polymerase specialized sigma24 family protein